MSDYATRGTDSGARVGARLDLLGLGGNVGASLRMPIISVDVSRTLDDFMAELRATIEPHWHERRASAAMNAFNPTACENKSNGCPCYFWSGNQREGPLCAVCSAYRETLSTLRAGGPLRV